LQSAAVTCYLHMCLLSHRNNSLPLHNAEHNTPPTCRRAQGTAVGTGTVVLCTAVGTGRDTARGTYALATPIPSPAPMCTTALLLLVAFSTADPGYVYMAILHFWSVPLPINHSRSVRQSPTCSCITHPCQRDFPAQSVFRHHARCRCRPRKFRWRLTFLRLTFVSHVHLPGRPGTPLRNQCPPRQPVTRHAQLHPQMPSSPCTSICAACEGQHAARLPTCCMPS